VLWYGKQARGYRRQLATGPNQFRSKETPETEESKTPEMLGNDSNSTSLTSIYPTSPMLENKNKTEMNGNNAQNAIRISAQTSASA
jgi:hypothetical protein